MDAHTHTPPDFMFLGISKQMSVVGKQLHKNKKVWAQKYLWASIDITLNHQIITVSVYVNTLSLSQCSLKIECFEIILLVETLALQIE